MVIRFGNLAAQAGHEVTIVTRAIDDVSRSQLGDSVRLRLSSFPLFRRKTGYHLVDRTVDLLTAPLLSRDIPQEADAVIYWADNTLPALFVHKRFKPCTAAQIYYCLQPPEFAYNYIWRSALSAPPISLVLPVAAVAYRFMDKRLVPMADAVFAISAEIEMRCRTLYNPEGIYIVSPGVDPRMSNLVDPDFFVREFGTGTRRIILTIGKLIYKKRFDCFVRTVEELRRRRDDVVGVVVGDGPYRNVLERLIRKKRLDNDVLLTGYLPDPADVARAYSACDVYLYLERNVPFGLTPLEASAMGKPVVAIEGGGVSVTVRKGKTGFVVDSPEAIGDLVDRIEMILDDPELAVRIGESGREHVQQFSWESQVTRFLKAIDAIIQTKNGPCGVK
jgi:glycosyltransferase involved in cell wall biosynthesis